MFIFRHIQTHIYIYMNIYIYRYIVEGSPEKRTRTGEFEEGRICYGVHQSEP